MYKRTAIATALLLCTFTAAAKPDATANTSSDPCAPAAAAQQGADAAIRKAEEEAEKFGEDILAASDLLEKCIGSFSLAGFSLNLFSDLGFSSILERLKKEICSIASDHLGDAADFLNDQIDDTIWDIIGGAQAAIDNIPGANQIVPTPRIQTPGINYNRPSGSSGSSSSGTSASTLSSDPVIDSYVKNNFLRPGEHVVETLETSVTKNMFGTPQSYPAVQLTLNNGSRIYIHSTPYDSQHYATISRSDGYAIGTSTTYVPRNSVVTQSGQKSINETPSDAASFSDTASSWWSNIWK